ncbi:MAG: NAD(P)-dependent oxidoreductase [Hyphomicrobiaceae bacterium]|jgi:3-hydroxyisobutyrate dehydrogenase-like beta-hydroxyacid dehydrogenase
MSKELGFIGVGNMGLPMARRLIEAGYSLTIFDLRREPVQRLVQLGAKAASSPKDVADQCETVFVSLPTPSIIKEVTLGKDGAALGTRIKRFVDLSTTGPTASIALAKELAAKKILHLDAPVSGGVAGAEKGTVAVMVSGPKAEYESLKSAFEVIGKVFFVGDKPGLGQTMKLCNNMMSAAAMAITAEAVVMGVKGGLDPEMMVQVINAGSGANTAIRDKVPRSVMTRTFDYGFSNALMYKDVKLCMEEAEAIGAQMFVGAAVRSMWELTNTQFGGDKDLTTIFQLVEKWAGVEVRGKKKA